ncbi:structural maintenance of chromosomes protein 5 [Acyrthosiphon pisum]|uniref:Structural maintenance of chromosomes protein 5 n=1 Tax=Acyrthosiphon pisum TaxID=7029 RepID=A0A8R2D2W2_ACYPI|nr:structural maintenance of chromosomes protein 5 [Acyrthosiphon pisum]|eukprot:XP_016657266.1 PREDICTED: structural maintenance of chromosomes protein 5 [Acyrthosiphon pisum]
MIQICYRFCRTFTEVTYTPHSKLNLIIGPNGSGKSSIVTALILGFGGNPKDINRGDKVSQFVKKGKSVADISIELYKRSNQNVHLRRTIFASNDSCHYYVNSILVSKKKFLPQDRLEDFSKLDSKGLLINALQSIENQDLLNNFEKLKTLAVSITSYDSDQKKLQDNIRLEIAVNLKLETIVSSFTEKKLLEEQLLVVLQKRCWSLYMLAWQQISSEKKKFEESKKHNKDALVLINQQRDRIKRKQSGEINLKNVVLQNAKAVFKLIEKLNNLVGAANCHVSDINELIKTVKKNSIKIEDLTESISSMEVKLQKCKLELIEIDKNIKSIDANIYPVKSNLESIKNKLRGLTEKMSAIDQELEREKRKEEGKNQLLQRKFPEMWKAITWLRKCDKSSIFHGQVFEPLFTQIEVRDQKNAKYIENIINYPPPANFKINEIPNYDINSLRKFGFHTYALDMIQAPPVIRRYLTKSYDMQNIPIGSKEVFNHMQSLPSKISFFFAGNDQVSIRNSNYTGEKITRQSQISTEAQFLLFSVDSNLIQSLTTKKEEARVNCENLAQQQTEFINQLRTAEDSRQPFFDRKKDIQGSFMKFQNRQKAYEKMVKDMEFKQSELKTEKERSTKLLSQNSQLINKYFDSMNGAVAMLDSYSTSMIYLMSSAFVVNNCCVDMEDENKVLKQLKTLYVTNMSNFSDYLKYIQKLESEFKKMLDVAVHWTNGVSPYDKTLFQSMIEKFANIEQNDVDDLDVLIVEKKAKLNCLNIDPNAPQLIKEYKERKIKIKNLEKKLENLNLNAQTKEHEIERLHSEWLPKIQELTALLCNNFQKFLSSFGCSGLIDLDIGVTRYDFQAYGLLIKVQFRNDIPSLRLLDAKSQSGGERALTTALFLLSLQEVTHFPFRIVDEINQGMDKVYERKLMELFMELFQDRNNQYLVVTPKLIKNLSFKNTTVDIIFCIDK